MRPFVVSLDPGSLMGKKFGSGSGMNIPDNIELRNNFLGSEYLNSLMQNLSAVAVNTYCTSLMQE
jgi:hypothetical protein